MTVKEQLRRAVENLPDDVDMDRAMERLFLLYKIQQGLDQADAGETVSQEEAEKRIAKWFL